MECSVTTDKMIPTRMYKALSELFLNSLMVANTDRMRQEKTKRKLKETGKHTKTVIVCFFLMHLLNLSNPVLDTGRKFS